MFSLLVHIWALLTASGSGALDSLRGAIDISRTSSARVRELELLGDLARLAHDQNDFKTRDAATRRWHELGDYERLRTDEQYFISIIQRVQAWMISQDARLCVEPSACSDVYADMKRATFEWIGPEADEDPKIP